MPRTVLMLLFLAAVLFSFALLSLLQAKLAS
jgi:hypothetical protein